MVKKIIIAVIGIVFLLIAAVAVTSLVAKTECKVEREVTINKPRAEIYNYVKMLKNQNEWGPWYKKEPTMKQEFRGTDGTVGFVSHWTGQSEEVGEGEQEIKKLVENERMDTELRFIKPFESKADAFLTLESVNESQTKVKWGFTTTFPRPMNLILVVMDMDALIGKDFADGLSSLKGIIEKQ